MKKHPRRAIWLIALVLTIAGLIATPREGAAWRMRWEDGGPNTTGDPDIPDSPLRMIVMLQGPGGLQVVEVRVDGCLRALRSLHCVSHASTTVSRHE